jgi:hypothetical protein
LDLLATDAVRSLGTRFDGFFDSAGWTTFLERKGVTIGTQKLYFRLFTHGTIQTAFTQYHDGTRRVMMEGAIGCLANKLDDYDFEKTYLTLEAAYRGQYRFLPKIEPLSNSKAQLTFLPNPNVGVLTAKYLIESFVIPNMRNSEAFVHNFDSYSSTVCASIACVQRAMNHLFRSFKIFS